MTEQFSQEYIDLIRKAKVLQALWCFGAYRVGDHVWLDGRAGVVAAFDSRDHFFNEGVRYFALFFKRLDSPLGDPKPEIWERRSLVWLPTLFQLIEIAGDELVEIIAPADGETTWILEGWGCYNIEERDLMLAAAQLAMRAVEAK